ncbi:Zn-ribbon domain-containing OB-fold protein [Streptomyces sp. NPDC055078]
MAPPPTSMRPDVFTADPPTLLASHCPDCDTKAFPPRDACPSCGEPTEKRTALSREGRIYSYTVVRQAPPGLPTPYILAYVDLPRDDIRVMSRIEGFAPDTVRIGAAVRLGARPADGVDDESLMFAFGPEESS